MLGEDEADPYLLLKEALTNEPSVLRHIELAEYLAAQGQKDEANRLLRLAKRLAPHHPVLNIWLPKD